MTIQETLAAVRARYGPSPTKDECGAICNETAWLHRNDPERWGVSGKTGGSFATLYDGTRIAADIIQNGVTKMAYDVLVAAGDGGPANPAWNAVGIITDPARPWLPPIQPQDAPPVEPPPIEPPPVFQCQYVPPSELERKVNELALAVGRMSDKVEALYDAILINGVYSDLTIKYIGKCRGRVGGPPA